MKLRVAINGFGRIGRLFFRQAFERSEIEIVAINDLGSIENLAYLLKYDSAYGRFEKDIKARSLDENVMLEVDGKAIQFLQEEDPTKLPWKDLNIDIVVESTGAFESFEAASVHKKAGAKRVVISAPAKDDEGSSDGRTVLVGVNESALKTCSISSNGSCTTNAVAPVAAIMEEKIGIQKAVLNTVHGYTSTQSLVDGPTRHKDFRKGRAAAVNIIPTTTGAAVSVARALVTLDKKFDGMSMRVPVIIGSVVDFTFLAKRRTSVEEINKIFKDAVKDPRWKDVLNVVEDPIVSSDIIGEPYGAIIDLNFTKVIDGDLVKVLSWYDNEWGYVKTLVEHVLRAGKYL